MSEEFMLSSTLIFLVAVSFNFSGMFKVSVIVVVSVFGNFGVLLLVALIGAVRIAGNARKEGENAA